MNKKIKWLFPVLFIVLFILLCLYQYRIINQDLREKSNASIIKEEVKNDEKLRSFILAWHTMKTDYYSHISSTELLNRSLNAFHNKEDFEYTRVNNGTNEYYDYYTGIKFYKDRKSGVYSIADIDDNLSKYKDKYNLYYGQEVLKINNIKMSDFYRHFDDRKKLSLSKEYSLTLKNSDGSESNITLPNYNSEKNKQNKKVENIDDVYEKNNMLVIKVKTGFEYLTIFFLDLLTEKIKDKKEYSAYIIDLRGNEGGSLFEEYMLSCALGANPKLVDGLDESGLKKEVLLSYKSDKDMLSKKCAKYQHIVDYFKDKKFIVWMDENSASATEIFISELIFSNKIKFTVGENTFGKGIAQKNVRLPDYPFKSFIYTSHILTVNKDYTTQVYGIAPNFKIVFDGKDIKRMMDQPHISPPVYLKRIPVETYKEYHYSKNDINKKDDVYYNITQENMDFQVPKWNKVEK